MASQVKTNKPTACGKPPQTNRARQGNFPNRQGKQKNRKDQSNRQAQNEDEKWKKIPPKPGEPEKKKVRDTESLWCGEHMAWTLHATKDCRVKKAREEKEKEKQADKPIVACGATTNQGNQNFQAVMAMLAQMATQEE